MHNPEMPQSDDAHASEVSDSLQPPVTTQGEPSADAASFPGADDNGEPDNDTEGELDEEEERQPAEDVLAADPAVEPTISDEELNAALLLATTKRSRGPNKPAHDSIGFYVAQIRKFKLLTAEEEVAMAKRTEAGQFALQALTSPEYFARLQALPDNRDISAPVLQLELAEIVRLGEQAVKQMVEANLRLSVLVARRYQRRGLPLLDLIQEGNLKLPHAVQMFDYMKGYKFSTYAYVWIRQGINRALQDQAHTVRLPVYINELLQKMNNFNKEFTAIHDRQPTVTELSAGLKVSPKKINKAHLAISRQPTPVDQPLSQYGEQFLSEAIEDEFAVEAFDLVVKALQHAEISSQLERIKPKMATVLRLRFGLDGGERMTLRQVGKIVEMSAESVRQLEAKALCILRHPSMSSKLRGLYREA